MNWLFLLTSFLFSLASFSTNMSICYFLVFCHKGTRANFVWNWLLWKGSFKKYLIRKMAFLDLLSPMSHVVNFFFHPSLPVSFTKKWQTMAWEDGCQKEMVVEAFCIILNEAKNVITYSFNVCAHSPFHINTHVLTNHVDKMGKL